VGTWESNIATGEDRWSDNIESIHGMPPGSFHGTIQDMMRTVYPGDREMVPLKVRRAIDTGEQYEAGAAAPLLISAGVGARTAGAAEETKTDAGHPLARSSPVVAFFPSVGLSISRSGRDAASALEI
jgi:hypothetical protein